MNMAKRKKQKAYAYEVLEAINHVLNGDLKSVSIFTSIVTKLDIEELQNVYVSLGKMKRTFKEELIRILRQKNSMENKIFALSEVEKKIVYALGKKKSERCVFCKKVRNGIYTCKRFKDGISVIRLRRYHCPYCEYAFMSKEEAVVEEL